MANFILSAFSDEYCDDIIGQAKALSFHNIEYVELRHANGKNVIDMGNEDINEIKNVLDDYSIKVSSIGSPLGKINLQDDFVLHLEKAKRIFETACKLNTKLVRIFSFYLPNGKKREECKTQVVDNLGKLIETASDFGLTLCHENEALIYGESPEDCRYLLNAFKGKLGCVFDMGNFVLDGYDSVEAYALLKDYVTYFHIKDSLYAGAVVPAGKGEAQIGSILRTFLQKNKEKNKTFVTVEPHLQTFDGLNALTNKRFDNPYKFENQQLAFDEGVKCFKDILNDL